MLIYSFLFFKLSLGFGLDFEFRLGLMLGLEFGLGLRLVIFLLVLRNAKPASA